MLKFILKSQILRKGLSSLPFDAKNIGVRVCLHFQYMVLPESQLDEIFSYINLKFSKEKEMRLLFECCHQVGLKHRVLCCACPYPNY